MEMELQASTMRECLCPEWIHLSHQNAELIYKAKISIRANDGDSLTDMQKRPTLQ